MKKNLGSSKSKNAEERKPTVLHLTTVHPITDVRIYQRECRSISAKSNYNLLLAGPGDFPPHPECELISLPKPFQKRTLRFLQSQLIAIKVGLKYRPDLFHLHDPELLFFGLIMAKIFKKKVIWDAHEDYVAQILEGTKPWMPAIFQVSAANLLRWLLGQADKNFAGIIGATNFICSLYSNPNTVLVGNEVRTSDFQLANPNLNGKQILFTGTQNNSALFMEVVQAVAKVGGVRLAVAGAKTNPKAWMEAFEILGDRLVDLGYLDPQGLSEAASNSTLGMVTYKFREFQNTSSPTKFFEFAASGLPIIATPIFANKTLIEEAKNGLLTKGFEIPDIYEAINSALKDRSQLQKWSRNGREWSVSIGNWAESEQRLLTLYENVIDF